MSLLNNDKIYKQIQETIFSHLYKNRTDKQKITIYFYYIIKT